MSKTFLSEYYSDLINKVNLEFEKKLIYVKENAEQDQLDSIRNLLISKIKEIEIPNLKTKEHRTCFFIPNINSNLDIIPNTDFIFDNKIGKLIIFRDSIDTESIEKIIDVFIGKILIGEIDLKALRDQIYSSVLIKLIEIKSKDLNPVIDLSKIEENFLESLKLDLKKTNFTDLELVTNILNVKKLKELTIISNHVNLTKIPKEMFHHFSHLKKLILKCSNLDNLRENNFSNLKHLEYLAIQESKIDRIEKFTFSNLKNLKCLFLSSNQLENLEPDMFIGLDHLEYLILNQNRLSCLKENTFSRLINLKGLELVENKLNLIEKNSFIGLESLELLNLSNNRAYLKINTGAFNSLNNLKILDLASNTIDNIQEGTFEALVNLQFLNVSNNVLKNLDFLSRLPKLEALICVGMEHAVINMEKLEVSNLKYLRIECQEVPILSSNLKNLQALEIRSVGDFKQGCFKNLESLEYLKINAQKDSVIDKLSENQFKEVMNKMRYLFLETRKYGEKALEKFKLKEEMFKEFFKQKDFVSCEMSEEDGLLFLEITDCESEWMFFEHVFNVSEMTKNCLKQMEFSISHYETITSI
ncbi:unnamed protein product [Brachionus calyciflorus]|uniref:Uncharacterized protein n=1 Tax=Brachionus calyciflorus TaxID=104777 RepID=A0A814A5S2_9BILA|nr:unnamed protein product [Brachionus calyciflorus]